MVETSTVVEKRESAGASQPAPGQMVIVDMGEHSRRRVRKLRRGEGRLMEKVEDTIADLEEQGIIAAASQTVVVIVRQEFSFNSMFDDDDDDDDDD